MANIKIAQLTNATTISDSDIVLIEDATQTKKMTVANLKNLLGISTGIIVNSGTNANVSYVKFGDGTLVCWGGTSAIYQSVKILYRFWTPPITTFGTPTLSALKAVSLAGSDVYARATIGAEWDSVNNRFYIRTVDALGGFVSGDKIPLDLIMIGRWKA